MRTVKTYLVRKPSDLEDVIQMTHRYGRQDSETVVIAETIRLDEQTYKAVAEHPMLDRDFLAGKGGYDDNGMRQVIALTCRGHKTLYADPSGSSYCRYLGVKVN